VESAASPTSGFDPPAFLPEQEIRYALVMYGGVSLAIYINGVVQEFFRLVRATAPEWPLSTDVGLHRAWFPLRAGASGSRPALKGSERVYRKLGQLLADGAEAPADAPIRTRFVVDILSGTSAGGINGILLAKALANQQEINKLQELWINEGDIADLLNDKRSYDKLAEGLRPQRPPRSLLNGYRLFVRAFQAMSEMEGTEQGKGTEKSPSYAEQIDLAVTATDLQGLPMPIKLYDAVIREKRHKNVFRFAYWTKEATGMERNDFGPKNNAMLAFAARCTSSFPFAFEPMVLDDLADVLPPEDFSRGGEPWSQFFRDYVRMGADYRRYAFADGGYLDNKPFTHATDQLGRRRADVPVERKLIYIEPDPGGGGSVAAKDRPEMFDNVIAALTGLPRTETIREDIDAVVRRSRAVSQLRSVTNVVVDNAAEKILLGGGSPSLLESASDAYPVLRRRVVIDELADTVCRVAGIAEDSDGQHALRLVAFAWAEETGISSDDLFARFDLGFELRRLRFVQHRINDLIRGVGGPARIAADNDLWVITDDVSALLRQVKLALNEIFVELRWRGRGARNPGRTADELEADRMADRAVGEDPERFRAVAEAVAATRLAEDELVKAVLDPGDGLVRSEREAANRAAELARGRRAELDVVAATLAALFELPFRAARAGAGLILGADPGEDSEAEQEARKWLVREGERDSPDPELLQGLDRLPERLRSLLRWYYEAFDLIDSLMLPLTYPDLGEVNPVDIIRISPPDAKSLIDETTVRRRKLAGTSFHHFGGFLDKGFRINDILWGRLDGAERIIETFLRPNHAKKALYVEAAQLGIIAEDLLGSHREAWVVAALREKGTATSRCGVSFDDLRELLGEEWTDQRLREALAVRAYLATHFTAPTEMKRRSMLDVAGRGTAITSDVVGAAASTSKSALKPIFWAGRIGRLLAGLAAISTRPEKRELPRVIFRNVAVVALVVGITLVVLGVFGLGGAQRAGWMILLTTALAQVAVWLTTAWIGAPSRRPGARQTWQWALRGVLGAIVAVTVALAVVGGFHVADLVIDKIRSWI
jgi:patatin-related protein